MMDTADGIELSDIPTRVAAENDSNEGLQEPGLFNSLSVSCKVESLADSLRLPSASSTPGQDSTEGRKESAPGTQRHKLSKGLLIATLTLLTFISAAIVLWPTFKAQKDADISTQFAQWTADKDFIEFCSSMPNATPLNPACMLAANVSLPAPPHFLDSLGQTVRKRSLDFATASSIILWHDSIYEDANEGILLTIFAAIVSSAAIIFGLLWPRVHGTMPSSFGKETHVDSAIPRAAVPAAASGLDPEDTSTLSSSSIQGQESDSKVRHACTCGIIEDRRSDSHKYIQSVEYIWSLEAEIIKLCAFVAEKDKIIRELNAQLSEQEFDHDWYKRKTMAPR